MGFDFWFLGCLDATQPVQEFPGYFGRLCAGSSKGSRLPAGNSFPLRALGAAEALPSLLAPSLPDQTQLFEVHRDNNAPRQSRELTDKRHSQ